MLIYLYIYIYLFIYLFISVYMYTKTWATKHRPLEKQANMQTCSKVAAAGNLGACRFTPRRAFISTRIFIYWADLAGAILAGQPWWVANLGQHIALEQ